MIPQDNLFFLKQQPTKYRIKPKFQKQLSDNYLKHYFAPWTEPFLLVTTKEILEEEQDLMHGFLKAPGFYAAKKRHNKEWIKHIVENMDLGSYPNRGIKAITVNATSLRSLPTETPSFGNPDKAGHGFPFDDIQVSYLSANNPVYILHTSKDRAWDLIIAHDYVWGWVPAKDLATVDTQFIQQWTQSSQNFITPTKDKKAILNKNNHFYFLARIGQIFPLISSDAINYEILVATRDHNGEAIMTHAWLPKPDANSWPLSGTAENIAKLANQFMGAPYGWGGMFGYRDCSATTKDLYAAFGIWLPRNSQIQSETGNHIHIGSLPKARKEHEIISKGIPFFTLLWMPGHIVVYIGEYEHQGYAFHSPWGLHTRSVLWHTEGRDVIGRAVITPLNFGHNHLNVPKTWLDETEQLIYAVPVEELEKY